MDYVLLTLIILIVVIGLSVYIGFAVTLGAGTYDNKKDKSPAIWTFFTISLVLYLIAATASLAFGAHTVGAVAMALSLFSDYILGWIVGEGDVVVDGYAGGYPGIKYWNLVTKTIMLALLSYLAGAETSSSFTGSKYGSRFMRDEGQGRAEFASKRFTKD